MSWCELEVVRVGSARHRPHSLQLTEPLPLSPLGPTVLKPNLEIIKDVLIFLINKTEDQCSIYFVS